MRIDSRKLQILGVKLKKEARGGGVTSRHCRGEQDDRAKQRKEEGLRQFNFIFRGLGMFTG